RRYDILREFSKMEADLRKSEIFVESGGLYRFKYPYIFYYCVAKYFQENALSCQAELLGLADYIYNETNANVLIFYVYLTKIQFLSNTLRLPLRRFTMSTSPVIFNHMSSF